MHISYATTTFNCPKCTCEHTEDDYYDKLVKSRTFVTYRNCKGCKTRLGISSDIMGGVVVWLKEEE